MTQPSPSSVNQLHLAYRSTTIRINASWDSLLSTVVIHCTISFSRFACAMLATGSCNEQLVSSQWQGLWEVLKMLSFLGSRWRKRGHTFAKPSLVFGSFHLSLLPVNHKVDHYAVATVIVSHHGPRSHATNWDLQDGGPNRICPPLTLCQAHFETEQMAQLIKCLTCKHGYLSSMLRTHLFKEKKSCVYMGCMFIMSALGRQRGEFLGFAAQPVQFTQ